MARRAAVSFLQEHSAVPSKAAVLRGNFRSFDRNLILGPLDPNVKRPLGGVGVNSHKDFISFQLAPKTADFAQAHANGRVALFASGIGKVEIGVLDELGGEMPIVANLVFARVVVENLWLRPWRSD